MISSAANELSVTVEETDSSCGLKGILSSVACRVGMFTERPIGHDGQVSTTRAGKGAGGKLCILAAT